jgi:hypothetical protein
MGSGKIAVIDLARLYIRTPTYLSHPTTIAVLPMDID